MHNTLSTQLLNSADEGCRMRPFRLNAFLFSAGLGDGFHDDLYDFIDFYYFWSLSSASEHFGFVSTFMKDQGTEILYDRMRGQEGRNGNQLAVSLHVWWDTTLLLFNVSN
jgi:hypothetical protein